MAFNYAKPLATANRLIDRFGSVWALRRRQAGGDDYDPTAGSTVYFRVVAVETEEKRRSSTGEIQRVRKLLMRAAEGVVPAVGESLMRTGAVSFLSAPTAAGFTAEATILGVSTLAPAGTTVMYELEVSY